MPRRYYVVAAKKTKSGGLIPDIPEGYSWVGIPNKAGTAYLIKVDSEIPGLQHVAEEDLDSTSTTFNTVAEAVKNKWRIRGMA